LPPSTATLAFPPVLAYHIDLKTHTTPTFGGAKTVLTDAFIRSAPPGVHWDGALKGFGLRVGKNRKTFIVLVASGRRKKIGVWPGKRLAEAREDAKKLLAEKTLGRTHPTHTAFDDALTAYLAEAERTLKPLTYKLYRRLLKSHYRFGRQSAADITPRQILRQLDGLPISEKRHAFCVGRTLFRWMERRHIIDQSPFRRLDTPPDNPSRSRVLSDEELRAVYRTARASTGHFGGITALLCLLGQRPHEIAGLQWDWIKEDIIDFPATIAKNGHAWTIPIGSEAQAIIRDTLGLSDVYVFPAIRMLKSTTTVYNGWGLDKARFDKACGVANWQLRDLRRTFATNMQRLGVRLEVTEALLNHVSGSRRGIVGVYQRYQWLPEMREAILTFERRLTH
jgi:integrase